MDVLDYNVNRKANRNLTVKILSLVALVCTVLGGIGYLFSMVGKGSYKYIMIRFSLGCLPEIVCAVLFVLYAFLYYEKMKARYTIPVIMGLLAIVYFFWGNSFYVGYYFLLIVIVLCVMALISSVTGFKTSVFISIAMGGCLLLNALRFYYIFSSFRYIGYVTQIELVIYLTRLIGRIVLCVAVLLFGLTNRIPSIRFSKAKGKTGREDPELALRRLNEQREFGMISEEEYQRQRAEIISTL